MPQNVECQNQKNREYFCLRFADGPKIAAPWTCPDCHTLPDEERRILAESDDAAQEEPQHCSAKKQVCAGGSALTAKQKRMVGALARQLNLEEVPNLETLSYAEAEDFIAHHSKAWMAQPPPPKLTKEQYEKWTQAGRH